MSKVRCIARSERVTKVEEPAKVCRVRDDSHDVRSEAGTGTVILNKKVYLPTDTQRVIFFNHLHIQLQLIASVSYKNRFPKFRSIRSDSKKK